MIGNNDLLTLFNSPVRVITTKVELLNGSTLVDTYSQNDLIKEFTIERVGENGKFFGFGVCQKINIKLIDMARALNITTDNGFKVYFDETKVAPTFFVSEVHRDEKSNQLSITAYDAILKAAAHTVAELNLAVDGETNYSIQTFVSSCAELLGLEGVRFPLNYEAFLTAYQGGANFDGTETLREALTAAAEATQTIYYVSDDNYLVFKRLGESGAVLRIDKEKYIELDSGANRRLSAISSITELGDNIIAQKDYTGTTQYIRNNPFWDLREDIDVLVQTALDTIGGLTINQFSCTWRGNPLVEVGDKIELVTKDNDVVESYVIDDVITYDGSLTQKTQWSFTAENEELANPASLGEILKETYAKVDKVAKQIDLVSSESSSTSSKVAALEINTDSINASVEKIEKEHGDAIGDINDKLNTLTKKVEATITEEDIKFAIHNELANGVTSVTTTTGFKFNEDGLQVSKTDSEMSTTITEDGMTVYKNNEAVLTANNEGVDAVNLHALTYLLIGKNSRFEDYQEVRTACFYYGGN